MNVKKTLKAVSLWLLACVSMATAQTWADDKLYRYLNDQGVVEIGFQVPAKYVAKGYDILSPRGRLLETIPPQSSAPLAVQQQAKEDEDRKKEDAFILRSFSSVGDVDAARKRRLGTLDYELTTLRSKLAEYQEQQEKFSLKAAEYQAAGKPVPGTISHHLDELERQQGNTHRLIAERQAEYQMLNDKYDRYSTRLVALRGAEAAGANP